MTLRNGSIRKKYYSPVIVGDSMDWMLDAACTQVDPEIFFPEKGRSPKPAKSICAVCDVVEQCLEYGLASDRGRHRYGVYGGKSERQRRKILRDRGIKEENDDEYYESDGEREAESYREVDQLLPEEAEEYGSYM